MSYYADSSHHEPSWGQPILNFAKLVGSLVVAAVVITVGAAVVDGILTKTFESAADGPNDWETVKNWGIGHVKDFGVFLGGALEHAWNTLTGLVQSVFPSFNASDTLNQAETFIKSDRAQDIGKAGLVIGAAGLGIYGVKKWADRVNERREQKQYSLPIEPAERHHSDKQVGYHEFKELKRRLDHSKATHHRDV